MLWKLFEWRIIGLPAIIILLIKIYNGKEIRTHKYTFTEL